MAQTVQRRRRGRDWRDPFSWFDWFHKVKGAALFLYNTASGRLTGAETFTRASTATYVDAAGVVQTAASGIKRDRHYINGQGPYLLLEGARTNLCTKSQEFDDAAWGKTRSSISANATTAPDGTATADKLVEDATAANTHNVARAANITVVDATKYATTIFAKAAERTWIRLREGAGVTADAYFNLGSGAVGTVAGTGTPTARIDAFANGWYRCTLMWTSSGTAAQIRIDLATGDGGASYNGDGVSGAYLWGADMEAGAFPSSYIPTTTAAVTRNADVLSYPFPYAPQAMTVYCRHVEGGTLLNGTNSRAWAIGDPGSNNSFYLIPSGAGGAYRITHKTAGGTVTSTAAAGASLGDLVETRAILYADGSVALGQSINGGAEAVAATSAANALAAAWNALFFYVNGESGAPGYNAYANLAVLPGTAPLAQCRAAAGV